MRFRRILYGGNSAIQTGPDRSAAYTLPEAVWDFSDPSLARLQEEYTRQTDPDRSGGVLPPRSIFSGTLGDQRKEPGKYLKSQKNPNRAILSEPVHIRSQIWMSALFIPSKIRWFLTVSRVVERFLISIWRDKQRKFLSMDSAWKWWPQRSQQQCFFRVITRKFPGNSECWEKFPGNYPEISGESSEIFSISVRNSIQKSLVWCKILIFFACGGLKWTKT